MTSLGQTMNALLVADRATDSSCNSRYYMAARTFASNTQIDFNNSTATPVVEYADAPRSASPPDFPALPAVDHIAAATAYMARLRSLVTKDHSVDVPARVDEHMLVTIATNPASLRAQRGVRGPQCQPPRGEPEQRQLREPGR
ncbi:hypothetical protein ACP70R_008389 [Stipagrostis hirtigluma subsp. patula]